MENKNQNKETVVVATMQTSPEFEKVRIEEGLYPCECVQVKPVKDGTYGARIAVVCKVLEAGVELAKIVYLKLTPNSAATEVVKAFGYEFVDGKEFNFSELVGKRSLAFVEDYDSTDREGKVKVASTISKFKPVHKQPKDSGNGDNQEKIKTEEVK